MLPKPQLSYLDFDIYSKRISFYYKNKEKLGSTFGFILTVSYAIISFVLFILYFIETIIREKVDASNSIIYPNEILSIDINNDLFYLAFGLEHPTKLTRFIDEGIYYPEVLYIEKVKVKGEFIKESETLLNVERCNITKFGSNFQNLFYGNEVNNSYCIKDINLTLTGGFKYQKMSIIKINIYPCVNNSKNNNHCKPQNIIDKYLSSTYFSFATKDIGFNPFNYSFPIIPIIQDLYTVIDKNIFKEYIMYFGIAEIDTDKGLFSTNILKQKYIKYIRDFHSFFFLDNEQYQSGKSIFTAEVRLEDNIYFVNRKYTKMSEVFSATGGYMKVISTIFALLALISKKISIEMKLLNNLFNFNLKQKKIILSIEYIKKLDYNYLTENGNKSKFIPYVAKKSLIHQRDRRNSIFYINHINNLSPIIQKREMKKDEIFQNSKSANRISDENLINIVRKISKEKEQNINIGDQSINRSKNNMINGDFNSYLDDYQINKFFVHKKKRKNDFNIIGGLKNFDNGRRATINFNLFDYYCLRKITNKEREIELFNFGINFYKSQMDIINFFNIIILTQIMLTQQNDKKQNILNKTLELSIN